MRIVLVGSSGEILGYFWFLEMTRENRPLGDTFNKDLNILDCPDEAKSWWQPQIEAT